MTTLNLTPARLDLLRAIADPNVEVYASARTGRSWSTADIFIREPGQVERKVTKAVEALDAAGLVARAPAGVRYHQPRPYSLTEAGSQALADTKES